MIKNTNVLLLSGFLFLFACQGQDENLSTGIEEQTVVESNLHKYFARPFDYKKDDLLEIQLQSHQMEGDVGQMMTLAIEGALAFNDIKQELALEKYLDALSIAEAIDHIRFRGTLAQEIAKIHFSMQSTEKALFYEQKAGLSWEALGERERAAHSQNYQGMMQGQLNNNELALKNFNYSLAYFKESKDTVGMLPTLDQMAKVYFRLDQADSALLMLKSAHELSRSLPEMWQIKTVQGLANGKKKIGHLDEALTLYLKALSMAKKISPRETAYLQMQIGEVYVQQKSMPLAKIYFEKALPIFQKNRSSHLEAFVLEQLSEIYAAQGDMTLAYELLKRYVPIHDSLSEQNNDDTMKKLTLEYETKQKDIKIESQYATLKNQEYAQGALIGGVVALLIIVSLAVNNIAQKKKANAEITAQKQTVSAALVERESLLKEIHHRVKNNLQIIASLLYLQSGKFENEDFKKVLEEGQGRVRSMALIHQKLYENDDLKSIPFDEYLMELVSEIRASFGMPKVSLNIEAENIYFDVDTAVPIGLIVNELATNAFKYAFGKEDHGSFSISLTQNDKGYVLNVNDNGKGLPDEVDIKKTKSLGLRLVRMLSQQLEGSFEFEGNNGTNFSLKFAA